MPARLHVKRTNFKRESFHKSIRTKVVEEFTDEVSKMVIDQKPAIILKKIEEYPKLNNVVLQKVKS